MNEAVTELETESKTKAHNIFKPRSWLAKIDFINHLVLFNNLLITVLAEKEGGKTSFNTLLKTNLDSHIKSVCFKATAPCNKQDILQTLINQLHLNQDRPVDLASILAQVNERKAHVLLLIDDAQLMSETLVQELLVCLKNQGDFGYFHVCLLADYSVVPLLNRLVAESLENLVHTLEIGPLSEAETRTYVLSRVLLLNLTKKPLTEQQFKRIYQLTKGNLALINGQLESFIIDTPSRNTINSKKIIKKAGPTFAVTSLAAAVVLLVNSGAFNFGARASKEMTPFVEAKVEASIKREPIQVAKEDNHFLSQIPSLEESSSRQLMPAELAKEQVLEEKAPIERLAVIPKIEFQVHEQSKLVKIEGFSKQKTKVAAVSNQRYTIQLVASHKQIDVSKLKQSNQLLSQTKVRHFNNAKGSWYILTLGDFDSRHGAQERVNQLPAELAKLKPWVRPVSGLEQIG